jgi:hypothetical protein
VALENLSKIAKAIPDGHRCFHIHGSFGDVYCELAVLKELLGQGSGRYAIIVDEKYKRLVELATGGRSTTIFAPSQAVNSLLTDADVLGDVRGMPIRLLPTLYPMIPELIDSLRLDHLDFLRCIMGSSSSGPLIDLEVDRSDLIEEAKEAIFNVGIEPGSGVIVSADNNSQRELPEAIWHEIILQIKNAGKFPLLNDSGSLRSDRATNLATLDLPKVKVPPHLAVTMTAAAGGYVGGTNGMQTIQALFNDRVPGIHWINGLGAQSECVTDKGGNPVPLKRLFHSRAYPNQFRGMQVEVVINEMTTREDIGSAARSVFAN